MRRLFTTVFALAALGAAGISHAQTADISWDNCFPLVVNKDIGAAAGPVTFYASVVGQSVPHQAYQVWLLIGDANQTLPDAWRFDSGGCNAGFFNYAAQPPVALAKSCPGFVPQATQAFPVGIFQLAPPGLGYATTTGNGFIANAYPAGVPSPNPATRYHLCGFTHDMTFASVGPTPVDLSTCGNVETPVCINLIRNRVSWLDMAGAEFVFAIGNGTLTVNSIAGCPAVPAKAKTWGEIKGQYRR
jgi:hypothetical protein